MSEEAQVEAPTIGLQDLQGLLQIVDVSAKRGTFEGNELSSVGALRDKLSAFLDFARQTEEAARAASEETESTPATEGAVQSVPDAPKKPVRKSRKAS